jgi:hypothetical protein
MADEIETAVERPKTPVWFWIVGVVALIWNGFGAVDYTLTQMGNEAYLSAFTEEQLAFYLVSRSGMRQSGPLRSGARCWAVRRS